ncbi:hypothetical protein HN803_03665 [candidate division WWE3 bacterium]|mgnify:FL=1|jgi:bifunctional ADP-heptose synthase (sugar kinase/adenylyltransferase)|nr:hypothetical protein [candidate division WWE3 bacterium]
MKIRVIGETLLDKYVFWDNTGKVDPATLVPVYTYKKTTEVPGGAGNLVKVLSDSNRDNILFTTNTINVPVKERHYCDSDPIMRVDIGDYIEHDDSVVSDFITSIETGDVVVVSNYHKGFLIENDIKKIIQVSKTFGATTFIDTNKVTPHYYDVDYLKINQKTYYESDVNFNKFDSLVVTKGSDGCSIYNKGEYTQVQQKNHPMMPVADSIGAGDSFFAGFISSILNGMDIESSCNFANSIAYLSCRTLGTI